MVIPFSTSLIYVFVEKLSNAGGRLIIASDGIWDALSSDMAAKSCRGLPAELAARQVVKVIQATFVSTFRWLIVSFPSLSLRRYSTV